MGNIRDSRGKEALDLSEKGRTTLAKAILEDESVRLVSQAASKAYIDRCDDEKDSMPFWMWATLWFCLGMLFTMTIPAFSNIIWNLSQAGGI